MHQPAAQMAAAAAQQDAVKPKGLILGPSF